MTKPRTLFQDISVLVANLFDGPQNIQSATTYLKLGRILGNRPLVKSIEDALRSEAGRLLSDDQSATAIIDITKAAVALEDSALLNDVGPKFSEMLESSSLLTFDQIVTIGELMPYVSDDTYDLDLLIDALAVEIPKALKLELVEIGKQVETTGTDARPLDGSDLGIEAQLVCRLASLIEDLDSARLNTIVKVALDPVLDAIQNKQIRHKTQVPSPPLLRPKPRFSENQVALLMPLLAATITNHEGYSSAHLNIFIKNLAAVKVLNSSRNITELDHLGYGVDTVLERIAELKRYPLGLLPEIPQPLAQTQNVLYERLSRQVQAAPADYLHNLASDVAASNHKIRSAYWYKLGEENALNKFISGVMDEFEDHPELVAEAMANLVEIIPDSCIQAPRSLTGVPWIQQTKAVYQGAPPRLT